MHGLFGVQTPASVQAPVQSACVATVQVPAGAQQEPVGCWQVFGSQTPPSVQVPVQFASVATVQVPITAQQEPVVGAVGLSSPPQPAETMTRIAATINSLRIHSPFSFVRLGCGLRNDPTTLSETAQDKRSGRTTSSSAPDGVSITCHPHTPNTLNTSSP
jgi:hypothetical protein